VSSSLRLVALGTASDLKGPKRPPGFRFSSAASPAEVDVGPDPVTEAIRAGPFEPERHVERISASFAVRQRGLALDRWLGPDPAT
jgi:hypothetical protein